VLLSYQNGKLFDGLSKVLESLGLRVTEAHTLADLRTHLRESENFLAIFAEESITGGSWRSVRTIASQAPTPLPVIVVAPFVDVTDYLDSMEQGASDYVVPPFLNTDIAHVLMAVLGRARTKAGQPRPVFASKIC
jgi:DNA-binding response OmpR family regulator